MTVTQDQVAALRAQLAGDLAEHRRLLARLGESDRLGYATLLASAFAEAVRRRFGDHPEPAAVIEFVGDMRGRSEGIRDQFSAETAERMILRIPRPSHVPEHRGDPPSDLPSGPVDPNDPNGQNDVDDLRDLDDETVIGAQLVITGSLIGDEGLDAAGLDAFLATVRATAERLTR